MRAFIVHCNHKKVSGFRWKQSCFMGSYFCLNSNCQQNLTVTRPRKYWQCCSVHDVLPGILVACRVIGSLPEQVKQKANLSDNSTLESLCLKKNIWVLSLYATNICSLFITFQSQLRCCVFFNCVTDRN